MPIEQSVMRVAWRLRDHHKDLIFKSVKKNRRRLRWVCRIIKNIWFLSVPRSVIDRDTEALKSLFDEHVSLPGSIT